jgi:hypothetical protein
MTGHRNFRELSIRRLSDFGHESLQVDSDGILVRRLIRWIVSFHLFGLLKKGTEIA